jgi:ribose/xylose/arabinose/galactoside ABC-type transport system permease subunit
MRHPAGTAAGRATPNSTAADGSDETDVVAEERAKHADAAGRFAARRRAPAWRRWLLRDELGVVSVLIVLVIIVGAVHPAFLHKGNLLSTAQNAVYVGLMAAGMVFPLAMREVDLSVGGTYALSVVTGAVLMREGVNPWLALLLVLIGSALLGALNGLVTTVVNAPSFIVTLASALLFRGLALAIADGKQITDIPTNSSVFTVLGDSLWGAPTSLWIFLAAVVVLTVVFTKTRFGGQVRALGSNPDAAAFSGLSVARIRIQALAMSGLMAGLAGVLALAFFIAGDPTIGQGYELTAIAACIIGGTPLIGGRGSVPGAAVGVLILTVVAASLVFFGVPINWTTFATGAVILLAVALDSLLRRTRGRGYLPGRAKAKAKPS